MTDITIQKLTKAQKAKVRDYYFSNHEPSDIATALNIELDTVRFMVFGEDGSGKSPASLYSLKKSMSSTAIASFLVDRAMVLDKIAGTAANIITKSLDALQDKVLKEGHELNLGEVKMLTDILSSLDKIVRLETGKATEHVQHLGLSVAEAREYLAADPFASAAIEAECKEVISNLPWLEENKE